VWKLREYTISENLRTALVMIFQYKMSGSNHTSQMSSSNCACPIHCRIGIVMTLVLELRPFMTVARRKNLNFKTCSSFSIVDCSSETASITIVIPLWLVESVYCPQTVQFM